MNNLSQMDIAKQLDIAQATVARYEQGIVFPKEVVLLWYADHFNVSLDWIFGRTENKKNIHANVELKKRLNKELKQVFGEDLEPGQNVYEIIKTRLDEIAKKDKK